MFNPSFCQELSNRQPARRYPNFPSGTHDLLVGDKRGARRGQTRPSWGTNGVLVGDKRQPLVSQSIVRELDKEGQKTQKRRYV